MSVGLYPRRDLARDDRALDDRTLVPRHEVGRGTRAGAEQDMYIVGKLRQDREIAQAVLVEVAGRHRARLRREPGRDRSRSLRSYSNSMTYGPSIIRGGYRTGISYASSGAVIT